MLAASLIAVRKPTAEAAQTAILGSYVFIGSTDIGESSSASVFTLATGNNEYKDLWPLQSLKYNYKDVKDFCEVSGVKLRISAEERKRHKLEHIS